jgi:diguanylate cyclase (GGDEF)-like protein
MWRRIRTSSNHSPNFAELGFVELVDMLLRPVVPVVFMGLAVTSVGLLLASRKQDIVILALTCAAALVDVATILLVVAYRRSAAAGPISGASGKRWENVYTAALWAFAALVGSINLRALTLAHPFESSLVPMLTAGITLIFVGGAGSNVAYRPRQSSVALALATGPTVVGLVYRAFEATDGHVMAAFLLMAVLLCGFDIAQHHWSRNNYETTRQQVLSKLDHALLARRDELTGLANRVQLRERFDDAVAALGGDELMAIHCLDLDRFKAVNDAYGHLVGDALLRAVTERLLATTRHEDTAARLGGDEFVVIQTGIRHEDEARLLARRIKRSLSAPYAIDGHDIRIGVSIGVSLAPRDATAFEQLIARADAALYHAKAGNSGGGVAFWGETPSPTAAIAP